MLNYLYKPDEVFYRGREHQVQLNLHTSKKMKKMCKGELVNLDDSSKKTEFSLFLVRLI
jgi:hypothetical protein